MIIKNYNFTKQLIIITVIVKIWMKLFLFSCQSYVILITHVAWILFVEASIVSSFHSRIGIEFFLFFALNSFDLRDCCQLW